MAAVDRRMPNLDDFVGLNWSCWFEKLDLEPPVAQYEDLKPERDRCETMTLRKEDMSIYGHCPAQDDFYLVVCSHCGKLVKPQAFEEHCNRRHSSLAKTCVPTISAPQHQPRESRPPSNIHKERQRDSKAKETSTSSSQNRLNSPQKEALSSPTVDKVTEDKPHPALSQHPRSQPPPLAPRVPNQCRPSSSSSPLDSSRATMGLSLVKLPAQKPAAAKTSSSPQRETRTYSRALKNTKALATNKKSEDQDKKSVSTQEAVQPKGKTDSDLPTVAAPLRDSAKSPAKTTETLSSRCSKFALNINSHIIRANDISETIPVEESPVEIGVHPPYTFNQSLPPSDDSDSEEQCQNLSTTPWHPKPLGVCTFGCRTFGCSVFTFDRRLHHLRIALSAMLDNHMNSHLWKKMPQPASNLRSAHPTPSARGSLVQPGTGNQTGSFCVKSTSLERLKNCKRTKSPPSVPALSTAVQPYNAVGHASKAHIGQRELVQKAPLSQSLSSKLKASPHLQVTGPLSKKTAPLSPLCPSERNTPISNEPLPPKPCPSRSKGRSPGLVQARAGSYDDRALVQKRKPQSTPATSSPPPSKKCPRLSPPSRSSLFSWKRDSTQDVWLGVWRKEHKSEDDTPGQY